MGLKPKEFGGILVFLEATILYIVLTYANV